MDLHAYGQSPTVYSYYHLAPSGDIYTNSDAFGDTSGVDAGDWISPKNGMTNYEARFSGADSSCQGTFNTWMPLTATSFAEVQVASPFENANYFCSFTVEIRAAANPSVILDTAHISLNANTGT
jgi:hypothetical protein